MDAENQFIMLSVSMISGCMYCARKTYLQYTLRLSEPPKEALVMGTLRHSVFESANQAEQEIVSSIQEGYTHEDITSAYKTTFLSILNQAIRKSKKRIEGFGISQQEAFNKMSVSVIKEAERRASNVEVFMQKHKVYREDLWSMLTPKMLSEFRIESTKLGIRGIIDQIEMYDNYMIPIELKTGKAPEEGAWPSHRIQLAAYMLMLSEKKREIKKGRIIYLDHDKEIEITINPFLEEEIKDLIKRTSMMLNSDTPPGFERNQKKCDACGLKDICYDKNMVQRRIREVFKAR
ncbi:CRISPR-associated protein Cas4 [Candidatus Woesearchaeota archaeon]|nr:CRISPR-associated protein Cas4 [Candidatus Woesearchaeota archaeon]